jgi:Flp pilus assembly pilin Flp
MRLFALRWLRALHDDERGAAMVEYVVVLVLVCVGFAIAATRLGVDLVNYYDLVETLTAVPLP